MTYPSFNDLLHELRTRELRRMPPGAEVFLSAGCAGRWYFDWIRDNYPGIRTHLGIEAYSPEPADLPPEAVWLADHIFRMVSVADKAVDLVFAGQTIEHLWPDQLAGFLSEAHRVLRPEGILVMDSPNQPITRALKWHQPEHTMEFSVDEIRDLVALAGFRDISVRGIWLCTASPGNRLLKLIPHLSAVNPDSDRRVVGASDRPRDSFLWWLEARKSASADPDWQAVRDFCDRVYDREFKRSLARVYSQIAAVRPGRRSLLKPRGRLQRLFSGFAGQLRLLAIQARSSAAEAARLLDQTFRSPPELSGCLRHGPYMPLRAGRYEVAFDLAVDPRGLPVGLDAETIVGSLDVCADNGARILAQRSLCWADLSTSEDLSVDAAPDRPGKLGAQRVVRKVLKFDVQGVAFATEFRAFSTGVIPLSVRADVQLAGPLPED